MPRFRRKGSSGDGIKAEAIDGYHSVAGQLIRKPFNAEDKENVSKANTAKSFKATSNAKTTQASEFGNGTTVQLQSLTQTREQLLAQSRPAAMPSRPLGGNGRQRKSLDAAYIEFQDQLRQLDKTEGSIQAVFKSFAPCAPMLSKSMGPAGRATLTWLGAEFAENLLAKLHPANQQAEEDATLDKNKNSLSVAFATQALALLDERKLSPDGFKALMAGFAAGMRGVDMAEAQAEAPNPKTTLALPLGKPDFAKSTKTAFENVAGKAKQDIAVALANAHEAKTLPDLIRALGNWTGKRGNRSGGGEADLKSELPPAPQSQMNAPRSLVSDNSHVDSKHVGPPIGSAYVNTPSQKPAPHTVEPALEALQAEFEKLSRTLAQSQEGTNQALANVRTTVMELQNQWRDLLPRLAQTTPGPQGRESSKTETQTALTGNQFLAPSPGQPDATAREVEPLSKAIKQLTEAIQAMQAAQRDAKPVSSNPSDTQIREHLKSIQSQLETSTNLLQEILGLLPGIKLNTGSNSPTRTPVNESTRSTSVNEDSSQSLSGHERKSTLDSSPPHINGSDEAQELRPDSAPGDGSPKPAAGPPEKATDNAQEKHNTAQPDLGGGGHESPPPIQSLGSSTPAADEQGIGGQPHASESKRSDSTSQRTNTSEKRGADAVEDVRQLFGDDVLDAKSQAPSAPYQSNAENIQSLATLSQRDRLRAKVLTDLIGKSGEWHARLATTLFSTAQQYQDRAQLAEDAQAWIVINSSIAKARELLDSIAGKPTASDQQQAVSDLNTIVNAVQRGLQQLDKRVEKNSRSHPAGDSKRSTRQTHSDSESSELTDARKEEPQPVEAVRDDRAGSPDLQGAHPRGSTEIPHTGDVRADSEELETNKSKKSSGAGPTHFPAHGNAAVPDSQSGQVLESHSVSDNKAQPHTNGGSTGTSQAGQISAAPNTASDHNVNVNSNHEAGNQSAESQPSTGNEAPASGPGTAVAKSKQSKKRARKKENQRERDKQIAKEDSRHTAAEIQSRKGSALDSGSNNSLKIQPDIQRPGLRPSRPSNGVSAIANPATVPETTDTLVNSLAADEDDDANPLGDSFMAHLGDQLDRPAGTTMAEPIASVQRSPIALPASTSARSSSEESRFDQESNDRPRGSPPEVNREPQAPTGLGPASDLPKDANFEEEEERPNPAPTASDPVGANGSQPAAADTTATARDDDRSSTHLTGPVELASKNSKDLLEGTAANQAANPTPVPRPPDDKGSDMSHEKSAGYSPAKVLRGHALTFANAVNSNDIGIEQVRQALARLLEDQSGSESTQRALLRLDQAPPRLEQSDSARKTAAATAVRKPRQGSMIAMRAAQFQDKQDKKAQASQAHLNQQAPIDPAKTQALSQELAQQQTQRFAAVFDAFRDLQTSGQSNEAIRTSLATHLIRLSEGQPYGLATEAEARYAQAMVEVLEVHAHGHDWTMWHAPLVQARAAIFQGPKAPQATVTLSQFLKEDRARLEAAATATGLKFADMPEWEEPAKDMRRELGELVEEAGKQEQTRKLTIDTAQDLDEASKKRLHHEMEKLHDSMRDTMIRSIVDRMHSKGTSAAQTRFVQTAFDVLQHFEESSVGSAYVRIMTDYLDQYANAGDGTLGKAVLNARRAVRKGQNGERRAPPSAFATDISRAADLKATPALSSAGLEPGADSSETPQSGPVPSQTDEAAQDSTPSHQEIDLSHLPQPAKRIAIAATSVRELLNNASEVSGREGWSDLMEGINDSMSIMGHDTKAHEISGGQWIPWQGVGRTLGKSLSELAKTAVAEVAIQDATEFLQAAAAKVTDPTDLSELVTGWINGVDDQALLKAVTGALSAFPPGNGGSGTPGPRRAPLLTVLKIADKRLNSALPTSLGVQRNVLDAFQQGVAAHLHRLDE